MRLLWAFTVLMLSVCGLKAALPVESTVSGSVIINEINLDNEYVELYVSQAQTLDGWHLWINQQSQSGGGTTQYSCALSGSYVSGEYLVIPDDMGCTFEMHQNTNEVMLLDENNATVHYVSIWHSGHVAKEWPYDGSEDFATVLDDDMGGNPESVCSIPDGDASEDEWGVYSGTGDPCYPTKGESNDYVNTNLIADYHIDVCDLDSGSVIDDKGGYDAAVYGAGIADGPVCKALDLTDDGTSDYLLLPDAVMQEVGDFTLMIWLKTSKSTGQQELLQAITSGTNQDNELEIYLQNANRLHVGIKGVEKSHNTSSAHLTNGNWHHIALTRDGDTVCLFVDGNRKNCNSGYSTALLNIQTGSLLMGQEQDSVAGGFSASQDYEGLLDEVMVYHSVLDDDFIDTIYTNQKAGKNYDGSTRVCLDCDYFTCPNPRDISIVYNATVNGKMKLFGNTIVCKNVGGVCTAPGDSERNNYIDMMYADVDGDGSTFASSSADLSLPPEAEVLWAGLYWQGMLHKESYSKKASTQNLKYRAPDSNVYTELTADSYNWIYYGGSSSEAADRYYFQGFVDITASVQGAKSGTYTIADMVTQTGNADSVPGGGFGAWAVAVVYYDPDEPLKNITIFDGFQAVMGGGDVTGATNYFNDHSCTGSIGINNPLEVTVSGFLTPYSNDVNSTFFIFAGEGDVTATGDSAYLKNKIGEQSSIANNANPGDDIFNASISYLGSHVSGTKNPDFENNLGIDIDTFDVSNIIEHAQTSTDINLTTSGDGYQPAVFGFETLIYEPDISKFFKTAYDAASGEELSGSVEIESGQIIEYQLDFNNSGAEIATNVEIFDDLMQDGVAEYAEYVPESVTLEKIWGEERNTSCGYDGQKVWCSIDEMDILERYVMKFKVRIKSFDCSNSDISFSNVANSLYNNKATGIQTTLVGVSNLNIAGTICPSDHTPSYFKAVDTGGTWESPIRTKIVHDAFTLDILAASDADGLTPKAATLSGITLFEGSGCSGETIPFSYTTPVSFPFVVEERASVGVAVPLAYSIVSTGITAIDGNTSCESDLFAVRPDRFSLEARKPDGTLLVSSVSGSTVHKAGDLFKIEVKALDAPGSVVSNFDEEFVLEATRNHADMIDDGILTTSDKRFASGSVVLDANYSEVGLVEIRIPDNDSFAAIDALDAGSERNISADSQVTGRFVPARFVLDANLTDLNVSGVDLNSTCRYTYLSVAGDRSLEATVRVGAEAQNSQGGKTQNYTGVFVKAPDLDFVLDWNVTAGTQNYTGTETVNGVAFTSFVNGSGLFETTTVFDLAAPDLTSRAKGVDPFVIDFVGSNDAIILRDFNVTDTDMVTNRPVTNVNRQSSGDYGGMIYYLYGRLNPIDAKGPVGDVNSTVYYEFYARSDTGKNILAAALDVANPDDLNESVNDVFWWRNPKHLVCDPWNVTFVPAAQASVMKRDHDVVTFRSNQATRLKIEGDLQLQPYLYFHPYSDANRTIFYIEFQGVGAAAQGADVVTNQGKGDASSSRIGE